MRCPVALILLSAILAGAALASPALAQDMRAPGVAATDTRQSVAITDPPWNSIARVQTNLAGRCTGTVIGPRLVLTAAHCLFNPRTRRLLAPASLHVLLGYERGTYKTHLTVDALQVPTAYDGTRPGDSVRHDWALLRLSGPVDVPALPVAPTAATAADPVALAGFSQDRVHLLMADRDCAVTAQARPPGPGGLLIFHSCSASRGTSGGPLLVLAGGRWQVGGVNVGITAQAGNLALWPEGLDAAIAALSAP